MPGIVTLTFDLLTSEWHYLLELSRKTCIANFNFLRLSFPCHKPGPDRWTDGQIGCNAMPPNDRRAAAKWSNN